MRLPTPPRSRRPRPRWPHSRLGSLKNWQYLKQKWEWGWKLGSGGGKGASHSALRNLSRQGWDPHSALLACALAVTLLAGLAPLLHSVWVYLLFQAVCHQNLERALWIAGAPMAVCARCFGIYAGALVGLLGRFPARRRALQAATLLLAADVASEWLGARPAWAAGRLLTGLLAGAAAVPFIAEMLAQSMHSHGRQRARIAPARIPEAGAD